MASSPLEPARNRWIFAACWLLWSAAHYIMLRDFDVEWKIALVDACISNAFLGGAIVLIVHTLGFYRPSTKKYLYLLVWCFAVTGLWNAIANYVLKSLFSAYPLYLSFLNKSLPIRFNLAFLAMGCATIMSMLWYNQEEQKLNNTRKLDAEKLARDAELYKLRQQLQPHFLFNSLNSISALAGTQPEQARKMIQQLSDFLRGALKKEDHQWVTLADELQHLQLYLNMEQMRFGHRLSTEIIHDEQSLEIMIPPMLLQPIVENAIKFGLYDTTGYIIIRLTAATSEDFLLITVQNPFDPETAKPNQGTGFGLSSVQRRLYLLFARNDLLKTSIQKDIFSTIVKIPRHDNNHPDR